MAQDVKKIAAMYDSLALEYAEAFAGEHDKKPMDREMLGRFARLLGGRRPVLDLGCGPGQTAAYLAGLGMEAVGLDLSEKLLIQARKRQPEISFVQGDLLGLPFKFNRAAGALAFYALVHFEPDQVRAALAEAFRVLRPGGVFLCAFHLGEQTIRLEKFLGKSIDIDFLFFSLDFISGCLGQAGFEKMEAFEREPYPEVEYPSRRAYVFAQKPGR